MLRLCAFTILLIMATAMPRPEKRTTKASVVHRNKEYSNEWHPSDLSLFEDWMRGYPEHGPNKEQGTLVPASQIQPARVSAVKPPPAFLADYEAQDFDEGGFGIHVQEDNNPTKPVDEYPDSATGTTGSNDHHHHSDHYPETTVSKGTIGDIHSEEQAGFDSLNENTDKITQDSISSISGIPGVNFPDYEEIPSTNFTCFDKPYMPGFYADMDTGCQVFHVCYDNRKVSFLCPLGTVFNQAILTCDYWQNTDCSRTPLYYGSNAGIGGNRHSCDSCDNTNIHEQGPSNHPSSVGTSKETVPETQVNTPGPNSEVDQSRNTNRGTVPSEINQGKEHSNYPSSVGTSKGIVPDTQVHTPGPNSEADQSRNTNRGTAPSEVNQEKQSSGKSFKPHHDYEFSALRYLDLFLKFFPIKAKVTMFPENGQTKVQAVTSIGNHMRQRITVYPVADNSKIVAEASIGEGRRQDLPHAGGYSTVTQAPRIQNQKKGKGIDKDVFDDVDDAFGIVRRVLDHVGRLLPRTPPVTGHDGVTSNPPINGRRSSCRCRIGSHAYNSQHGRPKHCRCYRPLPTLNPRFIVRPVRV